VLSLFQLPPFLPSSLQNQTCPCPDVQLFGKDGQLSRSLPSFCSFLVIPLMEFSVVSRLVLPPRDLFHGPPSHPPFSPRFSPHFACLSFFFFLHPLISGLQVTRKPDPPTDPFFQPASFSLLLNHRPKPSPFPVGLQDLPNRSRSLHHAPATITFSLGSQVLGCFSPIFYKTPLRHFRLPCDLPYPLAPPTDTLRGAVPFCGVVVAYLLPTADLPLCPTHHPLFPATLRNCDSLDKPTLQFPQPSPSLSDPRSFCHNFFFTAPFPFLFLLVFFQSLGFVVRIGLNGVFTTTPGPTSFRHPFFFFCHQL